MQDFVRFRIPLYVRRLATMVPAIVVVAMGVDSTQALVLSQVVLSLVLPVPMIALLVLTGRRDVMGSFVSRRVTQVAAVVAAAVVLALNIALLLQTAGIPVSFLGSN
jgi:manganese transport protein